MDLKTKVLPSIGKSVKDVINASLSALATSLVIKAIENIKVRYPK